MKKNYLSVRESESILFNLDSLRTHLLNLQYESYNDDEVEKLQERIDEVENLLMKFNYKGLTNQELSRVRELVNERQFMRYVTCLNSGLDEQTAAGAFQD